MNNEIVTQSGLLLKSETHKFTSFDVGWAGDKLFKPLADQESEIGQGFSNDPRVRVIHLTNATLRLNLGHSLGYHWQATHWAIMTSHSLGDNGNTIQIKSMVVLCDSLHIVSCSSVDLASFNVNSVYNKGSHPLKKKSILRKSFIQGGLFNCSHPKISKYKKKPKYINCSHGNSSEMSKYGKSQNIVTVPHC